MDSKYKLNLATLIAVAVLVAPRLAFAQVDPGVRTGAGADGGPLRGLSAGELAFFNEGLADFNSVEETDEGLGPRLNLDGCVSCHSQPAIGGTSPAINPQVAFATAFGQRNTIPSFITRNGPIREARFKFNADGTRDGGVHALFVISGREDGSASAAGCNIVQEDFAAQVRNNNVVFRIPTPVFGMGLIEQIPDRAILANLAANANAKAALQISGRVNRNGNDGTISRFGWKAQNQSALLFSGEAYNVEMGITNELFQVERDETANCQFAPVPNDVTTTDDEPMPAAAVGGHEKFAFFMRFLAPPVPSTTRPGGVASIARGRALFNVIGCDNCHTPTLRTGDSSVEALSNKAVNLFSDLALHNMGPGLADDIVQGAAAGDEFRTAPLWGLGQRVFFLHDGRTDDLLTAIAAHRSDGNRQFGASEANRTIDVFNLLSTSQKQDVLNFLRSL
jgi:CxxC motif-containing protein (DUF1111 family)